MERVQKEGDRETRTVCALRPANFLHCLELGSAELGGDNKEKSSRNSNTNTRYRKEQQATSQIPISLPKYPV